MSSSLIAQLLLGVCGFWHDNSIQKLVYAPRSCPEYIRLGLCIIVLSRFYLRMHDIMTSPYNECNIALITDLVVLPCWSDEWD